MNRRFLILITFFALIFSGCGPREKDLPTPGPTQKPTPIIMDAGEVIDIDGNSYPTLQIGEQVWMAENLRTTHRPDGEPVESFCYNDNEENCLIYGRLYGLDAAMGGDQGEGAQGICPDGWHIPSMGEWEQLINEFGGKSKAGLALKEPGDEHWITASEGAGKSGMNILPAGWFDFTLEYRGLGEGCFLRSSTSPNPSYANIWMVESHSAGVDKGDLHPDDAIPLRCVQD